MSTSGGKRELEGSAGATDGIPGGGRGIPGGGVGMPGGGGGKKAISVVESNSEERMVWCKNLDASTPPFATAIQAAVETWRGTERPGQQSSTGSIVTTVTTPRNDVKHTLWAY